MRKPGEMCAAVDSRYKTGFNTITNLTLRGQINLIRSKAEQKRPQMKEKILTRRTKKAVNGHKATESRKNIHQQR